MISKTMITTTWIATLVLLAPAAWAQPVIRPPQLGFMEDSARNLRPAFGLAGNFMLGPPIAGKVVAEAFSGSIGLLKTDSSLAAFDSQGKVLASIDVGPGPALFAFSPAGGTAIAYIVASNQFVEWRGGAFAPMSLNYSDGRADSVLAIAFPTPLEALLIVQRKDGVWDLGVQLDTLGTVSQSALVGVHAPLMKLPPGDLVYSDPAGIVVRRTDASEVHIPASLPANFSLQQMNGGWVELADLASSRRFAIHTEPGREAIYRLPESSQ
jgi:hypothetical protein